jgi:hypothetical protein
MQEENGDILTISKRLIILLLLLTTFLPEFLSAEVRSLLEKEGLTIVFEDPLKGLAEQFARVYPEILRELEGKLGLGLRLSPTFVLIKEHDAFRHMTTDRPIIAFAVPEKDLIVVDCSRADKDPFTLEETMKHELSHLLIHHYVDGREIPKWLDEGLAQYVSGGLGEVVRNQKRSFLEEAVLSGRLIGMRELSEHFPRSGDSLLLAYEESEHFMGYIIRQHGMTGVLKILQHLRTGDQWEHAVEKGLGVSFDDIEKAWYDQLRTRKSWFMFLSRHLYEILFFLAALASAYGFIRAHKKKRDYLREEGGDET